MKRLPVQKYKKLLSVFLAVVMLISMIPTFVFNASAATGNITTVSDPATVNDWKIFFGPDVKDTTWAGAVWSDKSVFTSVKDYTDATDESDDGINLTLSENNFLVSLSAIASSKSIEGYSTLPTDTILVLDLSGSMDVDNGTDPYVAMVNAANSAIDTLLGLNANNRVGVIAYSGNTSTYNDAEPSSATVILPLGRYTKGIDSNNNRVYLVSSWRQNNNNRNGVKVASGVTGTVAEGVKSTFSTNNSKQVTGGTYTQNGIYKAQQMFGEVTDTTVTDGVQAGTKRKPVMVLMSDGSPTVATTDYTEIGTSNSGNGNESSYGSTGIAFMTQLTAAWTKDKIEEKYNNEALVYTLGLNVGDKSSALSLLDPSNQTATDSYWTTFKGLANAQNKTMRVQIRNTNDSDDYEYKTISYTEPVNETQSWSEDYVTQYFGASNTTDLTNAFESIVEQIVIQSLYYPTLVEGGNSINHDGFLEFDDYIGRNMEVKAIKGIQLGSTLYDGSTLARMIMTGGMGTRDNPTDVGNNLVWAVQERMGIDDVEVARGLLADAYASGQLFYDAVTGEYSNYIGWYADADGKYVAFWDGQDDSPEAVPDEFKDQAVFAIKSYGYYDAVGEGHRETDMMYATIQVRTTLKDNTSDASKVGDVRLIGRLPASLIPLVEYDIKLNGTDPEAPASMTIGGATAPSRLIYEVGLSSDIDILDIKGTAHYPEDLQKNADGDYIFYTNQWQDIEDENYTYSYKTNKNTISFFEPSKENERYYYNVNSDIYTDDNGTLYVGENAPVYDENDPLYHRTLIYREKNGEIVAEWYYEEISEYALNEVSDLGKNADNNWYVKAGTIHHYFADYELPKTDNTTGTIRFSDKPFVHEPEVGAFIKDDYHIDSYLGNNGLLTVDAYEGIKVTKTADATITDRAQSYEFVITADVNANLDLVIEAADGTREWSTVSFNGSYTVNLKHGEAAYLLGDALIGKEVTVKENISDGAGYAVYSVNGDTNADTAVITVADSVIGTAAFVNTVPMNGDVVITKTVVSDIAGHLDDEFTFTVTLSGDNLEAEYDAVYSSGDVIKLSSAAANTVTLSHGESVVIKDLPEDAVVTAVETNIPAGFTANDADQSATVAAGESQYIDFTNTYAAADTDPANISITVNKNLVDNLNNDADWSGDFTFQLQQWNGTEYVNFGDPVVISYTKGGANSTAINLLKDAVYTETGNYYYRVVEVVDDTNVANGIVYDTAYCRFYVTVADNGEGKLYVSAITSLSDTEINGNDVTVTFNNRYVVDGAAEAVIDINKVVENVYGQTATVLPSGFSFSLYEADSSYAITDTAAVATSPATAAAGTARISVLYDELSDVGTHYYVLKEDNAGATVNGVKYTEKEYHVEIVVEDENSYYSVTVTVYDGTDVVDTATSAADANNRVAVAEVGGVTFTNSFTPDPVVLVPDLSGEKVLFGRDIIAGEFSFVLTDKDGEETVVSNDANGYFTFGELKYDKEGTYTYTVKEAIPEGATDNKLNGVSYDTSVYTITVEVTGDATTGQLSANAVMTKGGAAVSAIVFNNTYTVEGTAAQIVGTKHLAGDIRKLQAGAYSFELIENGEVISTVANGVPTDDYNAGFVFDLTYDTAGVHTYTVKEVIPEGADANNEHHGVVYDDAEFTVVVTVTDNGVGALEAEVEYNGVDVEFTNTYSVDSAKFTLDGVKRLEGDSVSKHTFSFQLYSATYENGAIKEGAAIGSPVTNDENGNFTFGELTFDKIGGYRYIVKELVPDNSVELMDYDPAVYYVEIDVTDNLLGQLVATPKYTKVTDDGETTVGGIVFNNVYNEEPVTAEITGTKTYNKDLTSGQFTFELYQALPDGEGKINAVGEAVLFATNDADGNFKFEEADVSRATTGYITYNRAGTYYYVIKEQIPESVSDNKLDGITYDDVIYTVTVTVTEEVDATGRSILVTDVTYSDTVVFENSYSAEKTSFAIEGHKDLTGRDLAEKEFTFVLYDEDGKEIDRAQNDKDGNFKFDAIEYTEADEGIIYTVKEDSADKLGGVTYDENVYTVTVKVTDDGKGALSAEAAYKVGTENRNSLLFENSYSAEKVSVSIGGKKKLENRDLMADEFTFVLIDKDGKEVTAKNNANGDFEFEAIEYTSVGEYTYTVKEDSSAKAENITYDNSVYTVTVKVTDEGNGKLSAAVSYAQGEEKAESIEFVNKYTVPEPTPTPEDPKPVTPETPQTGDDSNNVIWLVLSGISALAILVIIGLKKKTCEE